MKRLIEICEILPEIVLLAVITGGLISYYLFMALLIAGR